MIQYDLSKSQSKFLKEVLDREIPDERTMLSEHTINLLLQIIETKKYTEEQSDLLNEIYKWYKL